MKINQELIDRLVEYITNDLEESIQDYVPKGIIESAIKKGFRFQLELNNKDLFT